MTFAHAGFQPFLSELHYLLHASALGPMKKSRPTSRMPLGFHAHKTKRPRKKPYTKREIRAISAPRFEIRMFPAASNVARSMIEKMIQRTVLYRTADNRIAIVEGSSRRMIGRKRPNTMPATVP